MTFKEAVSSGRFKKAIIIVICALILLITFQAGMFVGFEKGSYADRVGETYFRAMHGPGGPVMVVGGGAVTSPYGAVGQIVEIKPPVIVVADRDGTDKTVLVSSSTRIRDADGDETIGTLAPNDSVVVFGQAAGTSSAIDAWLIRIMPSANVSASSTD